MFTNILKIKNLRKHYVATHNYIKYGFVVTGLARFLYCLSGVDLYIYIDLWCGWRCFVIVVVTTATHQPIDECFMVLYNVYIYIYTYPVCVLSTVQTPSTYMSLIFVCGFNVICCVVLVGICLVPDDWLTDHQRIAFVWMRFSFSCEVLYIFLNVLSLPFDILFAYLCVYIVAVSSFKQCVCVWLFDILCGIWSYIYFFYSVFL